MTQLNHHRCPARLYLASLVAGLGSFSGRAAESTTLRPAPDYQTVGVRDLSSKGSPFPVFYEQVLERLNFPLSWLNGGHGSFEEWRRRGRDVFRTHLMDAPPEAAFKPRFFDVEDRGTYVVRKVAFNLTRDSRVVACLAIPKGPGPFPAIVLMHDHSGKFDIGKEKMIRPWNAGAEREASAQVFVQQVYESRFIGDELAARGYVCLAIDALGWGDRGGVGHGDQQALASNLMHLGTSFAGLIAHEDLRAAEFLASLPEVDKARIGTIGLSMGSHRAWQAAALSDRIAVGAAICWMTTLEGVMRPGINRAKGHSAYSMLHPGIHRYLDFPDMASLACPKPMLFYNGSQDRLFPQDSTLAAFDKMRRVWASQGAENRLVTKMWDVPHVFNREMQEEAFAWLDRWLK
jgi:dienelactone hydrolase